MIKGIRTISLLLLLTACGKKEFIYYKYKDITVTRIDKDGESYFYNGYCDDRDKKCPTASYVKAEYYGYNNGMNVYMVFRDKNKVEFMWKNSGYFTKVGDDSFFIIRDYPNEQFDSFFKSYKTLKIPNIQLNDVIRLEKQFAIESNSLITATYR